ncbi:MAG: ferrochelatase [Lysobacterales bacterium 69-70]|nr:ferrochelatase [Xanthomonadaceae bacterium]ODU35574.1 MAG: ferrochelatase [Xanthomonadaceae bacterium SCN 69-320]ODV22969.1 MAG: ferrochelatase [Xanthomonadaceae bacterium SCN 69-25]OJY96719.1 MAG: ferrochelatase [Xanthomonadales bacterium 69-70]
MFGTRQYHAAPPGAPSVGGTAVLIVNLGTPAAPTASAVRRYLGQFLSDPRVVELPRWFWWPILYGVILRLRPARSARAYASIWTEAGSPLLTHSQALAAALQQALQQEGTAPVRVELAMTYGEPALPAALRRLVDAGYRRVLVLPLYPQYSATSTGAALDALADALKTLRWPPELRTIGDYHDQDAHIEALARSVERHWTANGRAERLLLSFHGIPQRCVRSGDPYAAQCRATAALLAARLGLDQDRLVVSFQSRVGREEWLRPYTDETLQQLARDGVRSVQVLCPGFAVDCLETLEEIAVENRERFLHAGGERYEYIPALNDGADQVKALTALIRRHLQGWTAADAGS